MSDAEVKVLLEADAEVEVLLDAEAAEVQLAEVVVGADHLEGLGHKAKEDGRSLVKNLNAINLFQFLSLYSYLNGNNHINTLKFVALSLKSS